MAVALLAGTVVLGRVRAAAATGPRPEIQLPGLAPILDSAQRQSPRILLQNINLTLAEARTIEAEAARRPKLTFSSSYLYQLASTGQGSVSSNNGATGGFDASIEIFHWGALVNQVEIAHLGEMIEQQQLNDALRVLVSTLRAQYLDLILRRAGLRVARAQLAMQKDELKLLEARIKDQVATPGAAGGIELAIKEAQLAIDQSEQDLENARRMFAQLAGLESLALSAIPDSIPKVSGAPDGSGALLKTFVDGGINDTYQAKILAGFLGRAVLEGKIADVRLRPSFALGAGARITNSTSVDSAGQVHQDLVTSGGVELRSNWPLLDGGSARAARITAGASRRSYERQIATYVATTRLEAEQKAQQVGFAWRRLEIAEAQRDGAEGGIAAEKLRFADGATTERAVRNAELALEANDLAAQRARAAYLQQWGEFVSLLGVDPMVRQLPAK